MLKYFDTQTKLLSPAHPFECKQCFLFFSLPWRENEAVEELGHMISISWPQTAMCPVFKPERCRKMCERYPCFLLNAPMVTWDALMQDVCHIYESSEWPHLRTLTYFRFCLLATEKLLFGWRESQEKQRPEVCLFSQAINDLAFHNKWISRAPVPRPVGSWDWDNFCLTRWNDFLVLFSGGVFVHLWATAVFGLVAADVAHYRFMAESQNSQHT